MKLEVHPTSLLAGSVLAVLVFVAMAPTPPNNLAYPSLFPAARDMVTIKEGVPYTVPVGKFLVITGLGSAMGNTVICRLSVNGVSESATVSAGYGGIVEARSMIPVPTGYAIPAGSVVTVDDQYLPTLDGRAWGYLERM